MYISCEKETVLENLSEQYELTADGRIVDTNSLAIKYDYSKYYILKKDLRCVKGIYKKGSLVRFSCSLSSDFDENKHLRIVGVDGDIYGGHYHELGYGAYGETDTCKTITPDTFDEYFEESGEIGTELREIVEISRKTSDREDTLSFWAKAMLSLAVISTIFGILFLGIFQDNVNLLSDTMWKSTGIIILCTGIISWIVCLSLFGAENVVSTKGYDKMHERINEWKKDYADIFGYEFSKGFWKIKRNLS